MNRLAEIWDARGAVTLRRLAGLLVRAFARLLAMLFWELRLLWARLSGRVRVGTLLILLVLLASGTEASAPSLSATAQGLAVVLVAGIGLWVMLTRPHWRRRW